MDKLLNEALEKKIYVTDAQSLIEELNVYKQGLSKNIILELQPDIREMVKYNRKISKIQSLALRQARKKSAFMSMIPTSTILYGTKSIVYRDRGERGESRMIVPFDKFTYQCEMPRLHIIGPVGLNKILWNLKLEKFKDAAHS